MNNILLIMPDFFSTRKDIIAALELNGYNVVSYSDRASGNNLFKAVNRVNRNLVSFLTKKYLKRIVKENKGKHFYRIVVINGQSFTDKHVKFLLKNVSHDKSVFYMWDALSFLPYTKKLLKLFDQTVTFNIHDYKARQFDFFLPLYIPSEYNKPIIDKEYKWDLSFVGTGKPEKIPFIKCAKQFCEENNLNALFHVYLPSKLMYFYNKIFRKEYRGLNKTFFKFSKLNHDEIKDLYSQSKCILDSGNADEGGLPLRVFEILGLNKKLILVNKSVKNYIFYRENQFFVIEKEFKIDPKFLTSELSANDKIELYNINNWVNLLINPQNIKLDKILNN